MPVLIALTSSMTTEATSPTIRFSNTTGIRLASERIAASDIREEPRMLRPPRDQPVQGRPLGRLGLLGLQQQHGEATIVAARSAPRIIPWKTGLAMSATTTTRMPVPRSDTARSIWPDR